VELPTVNDPRAGIFFRGCVAEGVYYDGPQTSSPNGGLLHGGRGCIQGDDSIITNAVVGSHAGPNMGIGNTGRVFSLDSGSVIRGAKVYDTGTDQADYIAYMENSSEINEMYVDSSAGVNTNVVYVGTKCALLSSHIEQSSGPSTLVTNGGEENARVIGNFIQKTSNTAYISFTGNGCIVDGNVLLNTGAGLPSIVNSGTNSVTGNNVLDE